MNEYLRNNFVILLILCAASVSSLNAQSSRVLTPLKLAGLKQLNEIAISSSGKQAAYTLKRQSDPKKENAPATYDLYIFDSATGKSVPYVTTLDVHNIAFRPGHKSITFLAKAPSSDRKKELYQIPLSGGGASVIFSFPESIAAYEWSPDGNKIAFMANDTAEEQTSTLPYQPDVYESDNVQRRGYVVNLAAPKHSVRQLQINGSIYQIHWSPDGQRLAVSAAPTSLLDDYYMNQRVFITDKIGKKVLKKVRHDGKQGPIKWSPDGQKLAMIAGGDKHDPAAGRLFIVPSDSEKTIQLQPGFKGTFEDFSWATDSTLYFLASQQVWSVFGSIRASGTKLDTIIKRGKPNLSEFERADNGTIIFRADAPSHPAELYQLKPSSQTFQRLTNSNPKLDSLRLGKQEVVKWNAKDGTQLQGILIYPVNYKKGRRYPLITVVHGGPESHYDNGWVTSYYEPGQVASGKGYFVFYPNYRGSTGRGEAFAKSSQGDPAGAEFDDIITGINELIKVGIADSARIGVTGASYGGYATGWFSTRYSELFAAGVMFAGVSDNISKWGTTDIPEELYQVHSRKRVWNDYKFFLKRSPIYYAGQAKTPLLIITGEDDKRIGPGQSYELYRHIKTRTDTPVQLVLYPDEGHGFSNAAARYDYNLRMMKWFDKYLKGERKNTPKVKVKSGAEENQ